jgi:two-component system response regulator GlrR
MNAPARPRILIVDDEPALLKLLAMRLRLEGFDVTTAESGERALAQLAVSQPQLVVSDLQMGGMDGMALFATIQRQHPSLPVIILTAHGSIPAAVAATKRGVFNYLTKPFEADALLAEIRAALKASGSTEPASAGAGDATDGSGTGAIDGAWRAEIITKSPLIEGVLREAKLVADTDASVFISGPSGSGKELLARAIHKASPRGARPFIAVNCGAIPEQLLESELFGHVKGSFTGAVRDHKGLFATAAGGTLFLDEIGDMPLLLQVKLLRVIQEREVRPVGSSASIPVDVRIISATHRDLQAEVEAGRFREDLYFRLNVIPIFVPPLRDRDRDIPMLAEHFMAELAHEYGRRPKRLDAGAATGLRSYRWPGNVRELRNVIERLMIMVPGDTITLNDLAFLDTGALAVAETGGAPPLPLHEARERFERDYILRALAAQQGNISRTADVLGVERSNLYRKMRAFGIAPSRRIDGEEEIA